MEMHFCLQKQTKSAHLRMLISSVLQAVRQEDRVKSRFHLDLWGAPGQAWQKAKVTIIVKGKDDNDCKMQRWRWQDQKLIILCTCLHCQDRKSKQRLGAQCSRFSAHLGHLHMHCLQVSYIIIVSLQCTGFVLFYVLSSSTIPWLGHEWKNLLTRKKDR